MSHRHWSETQPSVLLLELYLQTPSSLPSPAHTHTHTLMHTHAHTHTHMCMPHALMPSAAVLYVFVCLLLSFLLFSLITTRTEYRAGSFLPCTIRDWNSLCIIQGCSRGNDCRYFCVTHLPLTSQLVLLLFLGLFVLLCVANIPKSAGIIISMIVGI